MATTRPTPPSPSHDPAAGGIHAASYADTLWMVIAVVAIGLLGAWLGGLTVAVQGLSATSASHGTAITCPEARIVPTPVPATSGGTGTATAITPTVDPVTQAFQCEKLRAEVLKLGYEVGWWPYIQATTAAVATVLAAWIAAWALLDKYRQERNAEEQKRREERQEAEKKRDDELKQKTKDDYEKAFDAVIERLGSKDSDRTRIGAAASLMRFLDEKNEDYKEFHVRVFDLAAAHLRTLDAAVPDAVTPTPLARELGRVLREAYPRARTHLMTSGERLDASEVRLEHAYLVGAKWNGIWMPQAQLSSANLRDADLSHANLRGATLNNANISGKASLKSARLENAKLQESVLIGSNLERAHLTAAHLTGAQFDEAVLDDADLRAATVSGKSLLTAASLEGALLHGIIDPDLDDDVREKLMKRGAKFESDLPTER